MQQVLAALHLVTLFGYGLHLTLQLKQGSERYNLYWLLTLCLACHLATLVFSFTSGSFGFFSSLSLVSCLCVALLLLWRRLVFMLVWVVPFALIASALHAQTEGSYSLTSGNASAMIVHIGTAMLALALTAICTLLLGYHRVRTGQLKHLARPQWGFVPALETIERLGRQLLYGSLLLLGLGLITGAVFVEDLLAQNLAHKTFFSTLAWLVLLYATIGRVRGRLGWESLFWYLLAACLLLVLGYFGSHFVLEFLL